MKMTSYKADSRLQQARKKKKHDTFYIYIHKQMPSKLIRIIQLFQGFKYTHCHDNLWLFKANNLISLYHKSIIILTFCMQTDNFIFVKLVHYISFINAYGMQGCGNTMPDLSHLVPFHSGQVENFYLLVLGQVQMY